MEQRRLKSVAIICAKKHSRRFHGKNRELIAPVLIKTRNLKGVDKVVLATDDEYIEEMAMKIKKIKVLKRPFNATAPEDSVFNVARWAYYNLEEPYDTVSVILPNVINYKAAFLGRTIKMLQDKRLNEVRSYGEDGMENGIITMSVDWFLNGSISTYCGAIISSAKEIHYKAELKS